LSESFPADLFTIKKIIKSKWTPKDADRVTSHDDVVHKHWDLLKQGKITDLDPELQQHLQKFIHREFSERHAVPSSDEKTVDLFKPTSTEFANIILSSRKPKKSGNVDNKTKRIAEKAIDEMHLKPPKKDMFVMPNIENNRPMTYKQLSMEDNDVSELKNLKSNDAIMFGKLKDTYTNNKAIVLTSDNDLKSVSKATIRDHITIPKKYWKRGGTYKVEDCYYDDDGEFLYRVPGMK
jgi:neugrin